MSTSYDDDLKGTASLTCGRDISAPGAEPGLSGLDPGISASCADAVQWMIDFPLATTCMNLWSGNITSLALGDVGANDMSLEAWVLDKFGPSMTWPFFGGSDTLAYHPRITLWRGSSAGAGAHYDCGFVWTGAPNTNFGAVYHANSPNNYVLWYVNTVAHAGLPYGEWSHICITVQKETPGAGQTTCNEYINGVLFATRVGAWPAAWPDGAFATQLYIAYEKPVPPTGNTRCPAYVGPVGVHMTALTAEQVRSHYLGGTVGNYAASRIVIPNWFVRSTATGEIYPQWFLGYPDGPQDDPALSSDAQGSENIQEAINQRMLHVYPAGITACGLDGCYIQAEGTLQRRIPVYYGHGTFGWPGF